MTKKPLPPPEWFEEFRLLHLEYGARIAELDAQGLPNGEREPLGMSIWFETEEKRKRLMKSAVRKLRCTALKPNGDRCTRTARPDFFGQMCSSHAPHISDYPSLDEVRRLWPEHEYNRLEEGDVEGGAQV
ncbi:hypothetical protein [Aeromicrobium ginsengisoli]|uniref:Uncharacterized protein n=1 Tax=Aeromicrobium ginsengisoli TaxID=363867 RepID=A0A5M4FHQ6_9ACTN|nr:hypothetical protein [Aeromicrobium ginsengisoli]KAA1399724.1 hypothetical protein ESP70_002895 [Aeromicrobium ginsengisoli]